MPHKQQQGKPSEAQRREPAETQKRGSAKVTRSPGVLGTSIYRTVKLLIKIAAGSLVVVFGWLKLHGVEFAPIARNLPAGTVFRFAMALYYTCWVAGTLLDTDTQEKIYASQPNEGKFPLSGFLWLLLLTGLFGLLCWVDSHQKFSVLLTVFFLINILTWRYLIRNILPAAVERSREAFAERPFKLEKVILIYDRYLCGSWQWLRFAAGAFVLVILNLLAFSSLPETVSQGIGISSPELLVSMVVLVFVLLMESWIWLIRLKVSTSLALLDYLEERYGSDV